ncbi:hypothetical protein C2142_36250 [Streptomyces sp. CB01881]|nr:hypothetical protein C2142_36250 [Streptomyces sp. CB01881]
MRAVGAFAARNAGRPELQAVLQAFAAIPDLAGDEAMVAAVRRALPACVAWPRVTRSWRS